MPNQIAAIVLAVLTIGAGAVGAVTVSDPHYAGTSDPSELGTEAEATGDINISVSGSVSPGETVTLTATLHGEPVPHAPVEVNGDLVGETDASGQIDVTVPDSDEFEVEIEPEYEGKTTVQLSDEADEEEDADEMDEEDKDEERRIDLAIDGNVTANETVTVTATVNGTPITNADVEINGEAVGTTDANGAIDVTVPEDAEEFEVEAEYDHSGELSVEFAEDETDDEDEADGDADEMEEGDEDEADNDEGELTVNVDGNVSAGETVTVTATQNGSAVENALVVVNGEAVGMTDTNGSLDVTIPADADEVEYHLEGEWNHEFEDADDEEETDG